VERVFEHHPGMVLKRDHILAWRLNWSRKSENLRSMARELDIAPDSLIFVDDNPVECAEVQAALPEVLVLGLPADTRQIPAFLRHVWAFDHLKVTVEDRRRAVFYAQNAARSRLARQTLTLGEFLAGLELEVRIEPMGPADVARVAQLATRTNQFNCTAVRHDEVQIRQLCAAGAAECLVVRVKDRFGDYGLVGVLLFAACGETLVVDTFLLSCRVLGRGVEHRMLRALGQVAQQRRLRQVQVCFHPTGRNQPVFDFLYGLDLSIPRPQGLDLVFAFPAPALKNVTLDPIADSGLRMAALTRDPGPRSAAPVRRGSDVPGADREEPSRPESAICNPQSAMAPSAIAPSALLCRIATELADVGRIQKDIESKRPASAATALETDCAAPRTFAERTLGRIWMELLGVETIGRHHNFFDAGGHSLLATQVLSRVRDVFHVELSIQDIFEAPTLAELAGVVERRQIEQAEPDQVLTLLQEIDGLTDDQIEMLLAREESPL
jgi:FkbH-like protein